MISLEVAHELCVKDLCQVVIALREAFPQVPFVKMAGNNDLANPTRVRLDGVWLQRSEELAQSASTAVICADGTDMRCSVLPALAKEFNVPLNEVDVCCCLVQWSAGSL